LYERVRVVVGSIQEDVLDFVAQSASLLGEQCDGWADVRVIDRPSYAC
jgi:hypothetical protein